MILLTNDLPTRELRDPSLCDFYSIRRLGDAASISSRIQLIISVIIRQVHSSFSIFIDFPLTSYIVSIWCVKLLIIRIVPLPIVIRFTHSAPKAGQVKRVYNVKVTLIQTFVFIKKHNRS